MDLFFEKFFISNRSPYIGKFYILGKLKLLGTYVSLNSYERRLWDDVIGVIFRFISIWRDCKDVESDMKSSLSHYKELRLVHISKCETPIVTLLNTRS